MKKQCTACKRVLPSTREFFHYANKSTGLLHARCVDCENKKAREYARKKREKNHKPTKQNTCWLEFVCGSCGDVFPHWFMEKGRNRCLLCSTLRKPKKKPKTSIVEFKEKLLKRAKRRHEAKYCSEYKHTCIVCDKEFKSAETKSGTPVEMCNLCKAKDNRIRSRAAKHKNPEKNMQHKIARKQRILRAKPAWFGEFDDLVMSEASRLAETRREITGINWAIDHMIPITCKKASGLHVGVNIQVIPAKTNGSKHNKFTLTEPGEWLR